MPSSKLEWALYWAARGFRVFPLSEGGTRPIFEGWTESATTDPGQIRTWWTRAVPWGNAEQDYNIGILTTGWLVIDLDIKRGKSGAQSFFKLHGEFDTFVVRTPTGGYHLYYRAPYEVSNSQGDQGGIAAGVDGRGWHGFVAAAGSERAEGFYTIDQDWDWTVPLPVAPEVFLSRCKQPGTRLRDTVSTALIELDMPSAIAMATDWAQREPGAVYGQGQDNAIFLLGCYLRDLGVSEHTAVEIVLEHWNPRCSPPLSDEKVAEKMRNAWKSAQNPEGWRHPATHFHMVEIEPPVLLETPIESVLNTLNGHKVYIGERPDTFEWGNLTLLKDLQPRPWVIRDFLARREITELVAPGGVGKSTAAETVAVHLALASPDVWGMKNIYAGTPKRSVIYNAEDDREEMSRRLYAACSALNVDPQTVAPYIMLISGKEARWKLVEMKGREPTLNQKNVAKLMELLSHPDCVMGNIDPLVKIHTVPESDNTLMGFVMENLNFIATLTNTAMLLCHHTAKAASSGYAGSVQAGRGAGVIWDSVRIVCTLGPPTDQDVARLNLTAHDARRLLRLDGAKLNHGLLGDEPIWLEKKTVLVNGEEVGAFVEAQAMDRSEALRQRLGTAFEATMRGSAEGRLSVPQAANILRTLDPIFGKLSEREVRDRVGLIMVRSIELNNGTVLVLDASKPGSKFIVFG